MQNKFPHHDENGWNYVLKARSLLRSFQRTTHNPEIIMRVLIVDDQPKVRAMLRMLLSTSDIVVDEAVNGAEAVEQYAATRSDLVLMDVRMPVMDGIAATQKILSQDRDAHIVVVTDYDDEDCRKEAMTAGSRAFFGKGDLMSLRRYVCGWLENAITGDRDPELN